MPCVALSLTLTLTLTLTLNIAAVGSAARAPGRVELGFGLGKVQHQDVLRVLPLAGEGAARRQRVHSVEAPRQHLPHVRPSYG